MRKNTTKTIELAIIAKYLSDEFSEKYEDCGIKGLLFGDSYYNRNKENYIFLKLIMEDKFSLFYAENIQVIIDEAQDKFLPEDVYLASTIQKGEIIIEFDDIDFDNIKECGYDVVN